MPCSIKMVDGQAVVNQVDQTVSQLKQGDIILEINGMPIKERIEEQRKYQAIPEMDKILYKLKDLLLESEKEQAEVRVLRGEYEKTLQIKTRKSPYFYDNPVENGFLKEKEIGYIDPSTLAEGELERLYDYGASAITKCDSCWKPVTWSRWRCC